ncbi:MAG: hypothetical protein QOG77_2434 [Solirubrobacteraceae bacterium]|nr:hypothetical protein [Solirubrobacteraceae bacterium]
MSALPRRPLTPDEELIAAEEPAVRSLVTDADRVERMRGELELGFAELKHLGSAVSVFGSARTQPGTPEYELGVELGRRLGEAGFAVITGGGPGAMAAANQGARLAGVPSIGLGIDLPFEQSVNEWVDHKIDFHYFFTRKIMFVRYASAFVVLPGGFGTLDELFEAATLIQTRKISHFPIILVGVDYWSGLLAWLRDSMLAGGKISPGDLDLLQVTDDLDHVVGAVRQAALAQGITPSQGA